jgi:hypothetical protein
VLSINSMRSPGTFTRLMKSLTDPRENEHDHVVAAVDAAADAAENGIRSRR